MEVQEAIKSRRSIRRYQTTPIDKEVLEQVLEAARWAPSWANTQCWRFVVVQDTNTKKELAATLPESNPAYRAVKEAPVVIVACAELGRAGYIGGEVATDKGDWYMFDVALAMQNLVLSAHALGLGTVYVGRFDALRVARILGVPEGFCVVAITPLGYPDHRPTPTSRKGFDKIVSYEKFSFS